jgi:hypothetical protein
MAPRFDVIGDIHGCADQLEELLSALGYEERDGARRHEDRTAVFVGDFIDRGPQQKRTIEIVRPMIQQGSALAVLGNHEFNAICYATRVGAEYVRPHSEKNTHQHAAFLREFPFGSTPHQEVIEWFKTLPVFLDLGQFGVVHACWCPESFDTLRPVMKSDGCLSNGAIERCSQPSSPIYRAIERVLKGPEYPLPEALWFKDKDGNPRSEARLRWWVPSEQTMSHRLEFGGAVLSDEQMSMVATPDDEVASLAPEKPVFVGHYWLRGEPSALSPTVACVDYSVAKGGKLVAYRWDGEATIDASKFAWCK